MKKTFWLIVICSLGCGDSGSGKFLGEKQETVPVSGVVNVDGQTFANGILELMPKSDNTRIASSPTDASGRFKLGTYGKADGVIPGEYTVKLTVDMTSTTPAPTIEEHVVEIGASGDNSLVLDLKSKAASGAATSDPLLTPPR